MSFLDNLFGNPQRQQEYRDFGDRYQKGHPSEGYSDEEVVDRYREVARNAPQDVYEQSAADAFERMTPEERREFKRYLRQRARQQQIDLPDDDRDDDRIPNSRDLARTTSRLEQQQPGVLDGLLGGAGGAAKVLDNPLAKAALAGIAAMAAQRIMGGRGVLFNNEQRQSGQGNLPGGGNII